MSSPVKNKYGIWCTRLVVPVELRGIIGKRERKRSLGTKDEREAKQKHPLVLAELQAELIHARRKLENKTKLTDSVIQSIVFDWKQKEAIKLYSEPNASIPLIVRRDGFIEENNVPVLMTLDDIEQVGLLERERLAEGKPLDLTVKETKLARYYQQLESLVFDLFSGQFASYGVVSDIESEQFRKLLYQCALAYLHITKAATKKTVSDIELSKHGVDLEKLKLSESTGEIASSNDVQTTVGDLWESYCKSLQRREPEKAKSRLPDYATAINRFIRMFPSKSVESVAKRDIAAFRAMLERLPARTSSAIKKLPLEEQAEKAQQDNLPLISQKNIKKQLNAVSALFTFAIHEGLIHTNPAHGVASSIKVPMARNNGQNKGYTSIELAQIFRSPLYASNHVPLRADYGEAISWIPLLLAYTGARAEEIAQLYVADIDLSASIPSIKLTDERDDQSLKTGKERSIPIHSHLLELGLREYVQGLDSNGRLFPKLTANGIDKYHTAVSRWFSKYVNDELKINRSELRHFHAFRHSFITACRQNNVTEAIQDEITGHAPQSIGRQYGTITEEMKKEAIEAIPRWF